MFNMLVVCNYCRTVFYDPPIIQAPAKLLKSRLECPVCRTLREFTMLPVKFAEHDDDLL